MTNAWMALDRAAEAAGALKLQPRVWEVAMEDGTVLAIVREQADAKASTTAGATNARPYGEGCTG